MHPIAKAKNAEAARAAESNAKIRAELATLASKKAMTADERQRFMSLAAQL